MNMARLLLLWVCLMLPFAATARPISLQSGEHRGFSRLVAFLPAGTKWSITHEGTTVTLRYPGLTEGFNLRGIFDLIPRTRIAEMRSSADQLILTLDCACRVSAFVEERRFVVIDVASPGVRLPTPLIRAQAPALTKVVPANTASALPAPPSARALPVLTERQRPTPLPLPELPAALADPLQRSPLTEAEQAILDDVQKRLAQELGSAATRGVLDPKENLPPPQDNAAPPETAATLPAEDAPPAQGPPGLVNNMRVSTSMDLPGRAQGGLETLALDGAICPADALVDLAGWGADTPFDKQIGAAREKLFGEFDRLDPGAALHLARLYLHFGFGAEAKQALSLDPALAQDNALLIAIAEIMELDAARAPGQLRAFLHCDSDIALWAILAERTLDTAGKVDPAPALLALNKLPLHLRQFLAPALSQRFLSHGDTDAAATALRNLERLPEALPPAAHLAQAEIAIKEGSLDQGTAVLSQVVARNAAQSPEALISLVEAKLAQGQPISPQTAELVEAFAKELRDTPLGPDLRRTHVLALLRSGQFDAALAAAQALGGSADTNAAQALRHLILTELTKAADDVTFLSHVLQQPQRDLDQLNPDDKLPLARRLLDLDFAEKAQALVASQSSRSGQPQWQMLAAEAALALDQPYQAQAALLGLESPEADRLRAQAKSMIGDLSAARQLYLKTGQTKQADVAAWLSDSWQEVITPQTQTFGTAAALTAQELPDLSGGSALLARSTEAVEQSAAARELIADLLAQPALTLPAPAAE